MSQGFYLHVSQRTQAQPHHRCGRGVTCWASLEVGVVPATSWDHPPGAVLLRGRGRRTDFRLWKHRLTPKWYFSSRLLLGKDVRWLKSRPEFNSQSRPGKLAGLPSIGMYWCFLRTTPFFRPPQTHMCPPLGGVHKTELISVLLGLDFWWEIENIG